MQMKIIVDTPEDYKKWLQGKPTVAEEIKTAGAAPATTDANAKTGDTAKSKDLKMMTPVAAK